MLSLRDGLSGTTGGIFDLGVRFGRQQSIGRQGAEGMMTQGEKDWVDYGSVQLSHDGGKMAIGLLGIHGTTEKFVTSQALLTASQR